MLKNFCYLLAISFIAIPSASAYTLLDSDMNDWSWHQSTVLSGFIKPTTKRSYRDFNFFPHKPSSLVVINEEGTPVRNASFATVRLRKVTNSKNTLVLIIPGTFGDHKARLANVLSELSAKNDMDSFVVPNPFSEEFQFSYSTFGLVGLPQTDLINLATLMTDVLNYYSKQFGKPKKVIVVGLSLGALFSTLLTKSNLNSRIHRFIAVNPPLNLNYSLSQVDKAIQTRDGNNLGNFFNTIDGLLESLSISSKGVTVENLASLKQELPTNENTNTIIIGRSFSRSLKRIFGNLKNMDIMPSTKPLLAEINALAQSRKKSFLKYAQLLYEVQKITDLIGERSLANLYKDVDYDNILSKNSRASDVYVITNANDFIVTQQQIDSLSPKLGNRLKVFKSGGHCGNYWAPSFQKVFSDMLNQ